MSLTDPLGPWFLPLLTFEVADVEKTFAVLEERSRFVRENDHWFYLDGEHSVTPLKPGRNDPCLCGSGRKFKKCCG